jgi:anti-sigma regulatory factor (Ser/Thr protein kinase)
MEVAMSANDSGLRHNAFVYSDVDEYVSVASTFLKEGLELGHGAVVANTRDGIAVMREALGDYGARVRFVDVSEVYTRPAKTLAAYHDVYADELSRNDSLRAVADVQFGPEPSEWDMWTGYEAVFNQSFAHLPAWVLCSYNTVQIPQPILEGVWRTHPEVVSKGGWRDSSTYDAREVPLRPATSLESLQDPVEVALVDDRDLLREHVIRAMQQNGLPDSKVLDLLLATTEVLANASTHGGGIAVVRVGRIDGRCAGEVVDRGAGFDDPRAGYLAPRSGLGTGLWIARQLTWDIQFLRTHDGFTTRVIA